MILQSALVLIITAVTIVVMTAAVTATMIVTVGMIVVPAVTALGHPLPDVITMTVVPGLPLPGGMMIEDLQGTIQTEGGTTGAATIRTTVSKTGLQGIQTEMAGGPDRWLGFGRRQDIGNVLASSGFLRVMLVVVLPTLLNFLVGPRLRILFCEDPTTRK
jgi:hypothetical protein